ncbi:hypothetical protein BDZ89DRAFT_1070155 [Hymenopellis radicata]|nr:hypothetical protein BDZ89DRAFT_1070155 [Hymenopellis radicata]
MLKVINSPGCPIALERVDMRGMYHLMRTVDNDALVFSEEAQMIGRIVDRLLPKAKAALETEEEIASFEEVAIEFGQFMKKCEEGMYIEGF